MKEFIDLQVTGIDENATNIQERGNTDIHLILSPSISVPSEWQQSFNNAWHNYKYNTWVNASANSQDIIISCHHSTLHSEHMDNIHKAVKIANEQYQAIHEQKKLQAESVLEEKANKTNIMSNLKNGFKKP